MNESKDPMSCNPLVSSLVHILICCFNSFTAWASPSSKLSGLAVLSRPRGVHAAEFASQPHVLGGIMDTYPCSLFGNRNQKMMDCPSTGVAISHWHSPHPTVEFAARQVDSLAEPGEQKGLFTLTSGQQSGMIIRWTWFSKLVKSTQTPANARSKDAKDAETHQIEPCETHRSWRVFRKAQWIRPRSLPLASAGDGYSNP